jgi:hypothetical protein
VHWARGLFLMFHAITRGRFLPRQPVRGRLLAELTVNGFPAAGAGLLFGQDWWRATARVGACCPPLPLDLSHYSWVLPGIGISAALIVLVIWLDWPSSGLLGS